MKKLQDLLNLFFSIILFYGRFAKLRRKIANFKHRSPDAFKPLDKTYENRHIKLWRPLARWVDVSWLRFYTNVSGIMDHAYVPEDIYYSVIERRLNDANYVFHFGYKNNYEMLFGHGYFPEVVLHKISGIFFDKDYNLIAYDRINDFIASISGDVIVKPAREAGGGINVTRYTVSNGFFLGQRGECCSFKELDRRYRDHYVLQVCIQQHEVLARFNKNSVNTIRFFTYRSVNDDSVNILKTVLRMGRRNTVVDNLRPGGVCCGIFRDGSFNDFAFSKYGDRLYSHPDSHIEFKGAYIPHFDRIIETVADLARKIPTLRLLSFDVTLETNGNPKVIEINTMSMDINFVQWHDGSLFGDYTEEVIHFCRGHKERDNHSVLRFLRT